MHNLIVGLTGSGKSRLCREIIVPRWCAKGVAVLVLDPLLQPWPGAHWVTDDPEAFLATAKASRSCVLIADEAQETMRGTPERERKMVWTATQSRNCGHLAYFLGQRAMQMPPNVRSNCTNGYIFRQQAPDLKVLEGIFSGDLSAITDFPPGVCYRVSAFGKPEKMRVF